MPNAFGVDPLSESPDVVIHLPNATLADLASGPKKIVTDEGSVEERSADEIIALDRHLTAHAVGDSPLHGLRISRFKPAGP